MDLKKRNLFTIRSKEARWILCPHSWTCVGSLHVPEVASCLETSFTSGSVQDCMSREVKNRKVSIFLVQFSERYQSIRPVGMSVQFAGALPACGVTLRTSKRDLSTLCSDSPTVWPGSGYQTNISQQPNRAKSSNEALLRPSSCLFNTLVKPALNIGSCFLRNYLKQ